MRKRPLTLVLTCAGILLVLLLAGVALAPRQPPRQTVRLPDGSVMTLEGVTYGRQHRLLLGGWWQKLLYPFVPARVQARLGCEAFQLYPRPHDRLVFWTRHTGRGRSGFRQLIRRPYSATMWHTRVVAFDEHGCESPEGLLATGDWGDHQVAAWAVPAFPRRGETVGLRIYELAPGDRWIRAAEFTVRNPLPGSHPQWPTTPPPVVRTDGDLTFTLTSFVTDTTGDALGRRAAPGEEAFSRARWAVTRNGVPAPGWRLLDLKIADATGNDWTPYPGVFWTSKEKGAGPLEGVWRGNLWPDERAWKLRAEFSRLGAAPPDRVWNLSAIKIPEPRPAPATELVTGDGLKVRVIVVPDRALARRTPATAMGGTHRVQVWVSPPSADLRLALLGGSDQKGRPVERGDGDRDLSGANSFRFPLPSGATSLNLRIGGYRSRFVEFVASPRLRHPSPSELR